MNSSTPHDREAAAAIAGMSDIYGTCTYAVGDRITYRLREWGNAGYEVGRVIGHTEVQASPRLVVEAEDDHTTRVIDARPWPTGNVLPF